MVLGAHLSKNSHRHHVDGNHPKPEDRDHYEKVESISASYCQDRDMVSNVWDSGTRRGRARNAQSPCGIALVQNVTEFERDNEAQKSIMMQGAEILGTNQQMKMHPRPGEQ